MNAAEGVADEANTALETMRQRNELLQLALDQKNATPATPSGPPDPFDYDDGAKDAKYVEALHEYNRGFFKSEMARHTEAQPKPVDTRARDARQTAHYEAADKLGVKDYAETEDKTIAILGRDTVVEIIGALDKSPEYMYYLGKNPDKAEYFADLLKRHPVKGILEIGDFARDLQKLRKSKRNAAPDPDDELEGSSVSRNSKSTRGPAGATFS